MPPLRGAAALLSFFPSLPYGTLDPVFDPAAMSGACPQLTADVAFLYHMVETEKEQVQLLRALQSLEVEVHDLTNAFPSATVASGLC